MRFLLMFCPRSNQRAQPGRDRRHLVSGETSTRRDTYCDPWWGRATEAPDCLDRIAPFEGSCRDRRWL